MHGQGCVLQAAGGTVCISKDKDHARVKIAEVSQVQRSKPLSREGRSGGRTGAGRMPSCQPVPVPTELPLVRRAGVMSALAV